MSRRTYQLLALALTLSGTSACDEAPAFGAGDIALRPGGYSSGGVLINTSATGDWAVAHLDTNFGTDLDGVILDSVVINAGGKYENQEVKLEKVWVKNGEIFGAWKWLEFSGADFVGSKWNLKIPGSMTAPDRVMTLDKYTLDPEGHHRYTFMYPNDPSYGVHFFSYLLFGKAGQPAPSKEEQDEKPAQSLAVCAPDPETGGSIEALVYGDVYVDMTSGDAKDRPLTMLIACVSGGTGKAGLWEFLPYTVGLEGFVTGMRTVRADYCGDGSTYTKPGNQLYLEDIYGLHNFGNAAGNVTEAIMSPKGALCLEEPRDANFGYWDVDCGGGPPPPCKDAKLTDFSDAIMHSKNIF